MISQAERGELVTFARDSIARGSKSFAAASRLFDPQIRDRACLLYAWCRAADDLADGQDMGHGMSAVPEAREQLALMRERTEAALAGQWSGIPAYDALALVVQECAIPARYARDLIAGFALDAEGSEPANEEALYRYCYHVAGAVGCMMAIIMGVPPDDEATLDRACDLGIAFQLANIARDVSEDGAAGRCYLPLDWLADLNIPRRELLEPTHRDQLAVLAKRLADRAEKFEASARYGARKLSYRSAWAVLAAAGIYGDIAREVRRRGARAWDRRVTTSKAAKLSWIVRAGWQASRRAAIPDVGRNDLWTRLHHP